MRFTKQYTYELAGKGGFSRAYSEQLCMHEIRDVQFHQQSLDNQETIFTVIIFV